MRVVAPGAEASVGSGRAEGGEAAPVSSHAGGALQSRSAPGAPQAPRHQRHVWPRPTE